MNKNRIGLLGLILVVFFWGAGFPLIKYAGESFPPLYQIGFRFFIASSSLALIFHKKLKYIDKKTLKNSFILSIVLYGVYLCAVIGIQYTTSTNASFYCCLSILVVPFLSRFIIKTKIQGKSILCAFICLIGLSLLSFSGNAGFNIGDLICLGSSFTFALQIVLTEIFIKDCDTTLISILEMFFVSIFGFLAAFVFEDFPTAITVKSIYSMLFLGICCTAFAFWMQTTCQKFLSSVQIAAVFTLEPLFGVIMSCILLDETLGFKGVIGGILILLALFASETDIKNLFKKRKKYNNGELK